ncbi:unnamed protein product [Citrullus colocynthis]|uniref:Alpha/beta hydrolase fold-3 domain-containing protein n=1 Tax=Citrullus colocynthis TaxID=252529 RepID=A0ABP0Z2S8_9ROSI
MPEHHSHLIYYMKFKRMAAISMDPRLTLQMPKLRIQNEATVEEIEGLIRVYADGHVERPPIIPNVSCSTTASDKGVTAKDVTIGNFTNTWVRIYVVNSQRNLPLLVYFHGGGFCVGSAAWSCYHEFLLDLASKAKCVILSVNYRLSPENRLPAAYEDGYNTLMWLKQQAITNPIEHKWWLGNCNPSKLFLAGDSAGANIAYNIATRLGLNEPTILKPLTLKGIVLIQPFFGGESRTKSEKLAAQPSSASALTLDAADTYWRLSLPSGANRDHTWSNPVANGGAKLRETKVPPLMVCISELDILVDRNLEFCAAMAAAGKKVESVILKGVGHSFQILNKDQISSLRRQEMMGCIQAFLQQ